MESVSVHALVQENKRLRTALEQVRDMPFSMVNDSESLRHTIKVMQHLATKAFDK